MPPRSKPKVDQIKLFCGAGKGTRTLDRFLEADLKSAAYTNFAIPAVGSFHLVYFRLTASEIRSTYC